ncbi:MAG: cytochrome C oxidase subunit IV family protein [Nitrospirae bacterium]|nr:cytochrome C oxidase subunit IV family protein [Nitrospirota bacterium]
MGKEQTGTEEHIVSYSTYAYVWLALLVLLGATIAAARIEFSRYSVLINLLIATVKALLVVVFFMHMKYEKRFLRGLLIMSLLTLGSIIALTFSDVWYR